MVFNYAEVYGYECGEERVRRGEESRNPGFVFDNPLQLRCDKREMAKLTSSVCLTSFLSRPWFYLFSFFSWLPMIQRQHYIQTQRFLHIEHPYK
jgi:hypothetical protein